MIYDIFFLHSIFLVDCVPLGGFWYGWDIYLFLVCPLEIPFGFGMADTTYDLCARRSRATWQQRQQGDIEWFEFESMISSGE